MKRRTLTIVVAVFAAAGLGTLFFATRPAKPAVSVQPPAEQQVAVAENTYTDSTVLGVSSEESTQANPPIDVRPRPVTRTIRVPARTAAESPAVQTTPPAEPPATETVPDVPKEVCDINYVPCVPVAENDLACSDIAMVVTIKGDDRHLFDDDGDGTGCEEYANDPAAEVTPEPPPSRSPIILTDEKIIDILQDDTPDAFSPQP